MMKIMDFLKKLFNPEYLTEEEQQIIVGKIIEKIRSS